MIAALRSLTITVVWLVMLAAGTALAREDVAGVPTNRFPVEEVSWNDAVAFCRRLSTLTEEARRGRIYRLPTEAEWEYACRAGSRTRFHVGDTLSSRQANIGFKLKTKLAAVGFYGPNAFALYDMHGNVREWCADWYGAYSGNTKVDPTGPDSGRSRVIRGGCFYHGADLSTSTTRFFSEPDYSDYSIGFRVACELR